MLKYKDERIANRRSNQLKYLLLIQFSNSIPNPAGSKIKLKSQSDLEILESVYSVFYT